MVEIFEEINDKHIKEELNNLKEDIIDSQDRHSKPEQKEDPIDINRMIGHGAIFGLKNWWIGGFLNKRESRIKTDEFIESISKAIGKESSKITGNVPYQLEPMYYKPWYTPMPRKPNERITPNNITKEELKNNFTAFKAKVTDRSKNEDQEYLAKIIAWIVLKNKNIWCLKASVSSLEIYDPSNERMEWKCCFKIQWEEIHIKKLLSKTFGIIERRDTITDITDETLDYLVELWYKQK
jgi:hypothetical protein